MLNIFYMIQILFKGQLSYVFNIIQQSEKNDNKIKS